MNGFALGEGSEIVLACDLAVISADATRGLPGVTCGPAAAACGPLRLHRQIPPQLAAEVAFTGAPLDAQVSGALGLVNGPCPAEQVLDTALELARTLPWPCRPASGP